MGLSPVTGSMMKASRGTESAFELHSVRSAQGQVLAWANRTQLRLESIR